MGYAFAQPTLHLDSRLRGNDKDGAAGFAALYPPYNDTYVATGRAEGLSPSAFYSFPLCQRGIEGDWAKG